MEKNKTVSVIIPCYNAEDFIVKALDSVQSQTYKPNEIIIINDGSQDDSLSVIREYIENKATLEIKCFTFDNQGPSCSRNEGVTRASYEYIAFLDADDEWYQTKLEEQLSIVNSDSFSSSDCDLIDNKGVKVGYHENSVDVKVAKNVKDLYLGKISMLTPGLVMPRKAFIDVGGFDNSLRYKEDHFLVLKLIEKGLSFKYIEKKLFRVRTHPGSGRNNINEDNIIKSFYSFDSLAREIFPHLIEYRELFLSELYFVLFKSYVGNNIFKSIKFSIMAFKRNYSLKYFMSILLSFLPFKKDFFVNVKSKFKRR